MLSVVEVVKIDVLQVGVVSAHAYFADSHVRDACFGGGGRDDVAVEQFQPTSISLLVRPLLLLRHISLVVLSKPSCFDSIRHVVN